jgi:hypothetical protein
MKKRNTLSLSLHVLWVYENLTITFRSRHSGGRDVVQELKTVIGCVYVVRGMQEGHLLVASGALSLVYVHSHIPGIACHLGYSRLELPPNPLVEAVPHDAESRQDTESNEADDNEEQRIVTTRVSRDAARKKGSRFVCTTKWTISPARHQITHASVFLYYRSGHST